MADIVIFNPKSKLGVKKIEKLNNIDRKIPFFTSGKKTFYVNEWLVNSENIFMNDGGVADFKFYNGTANYSDHVISFKSKNTNIVLNKFIFYSLMNQKNRINDEFFIGSGLKNISKTKFSEFIIFIPSIKEQQKIVEILDKFSNIINNLENGIPKEMELRKKQYLYWRNKLLSFEC